MVTGFAARREIVEGRALPGTEPVLAPQPTSFANGRYEVKRFLGEGGKKKVYLAYDTLSDGMKAMIADLRTVNLYNKKKKRPAAMAQR